MQIDLIKLIKILLPTFLRQKKMVQMLFVLLLEARESFNAFLLRVEDWKYRAKSDGSVLSLQETIRREMDVDAVITELDGKPVDFLVTVTGAADEIRLKSIIEDNAIAGRSFVFKVGSVTYTAAYSNHVCEDMIEIYTAAYNSYVCEIDRNVYIYARTLLHPNGNWVTRLISSRNVMSDISVSGVVRFNNYAGANISSIAFSGVIAAGTNYAEVIIGVVDTYYSVDTEINSVSPDVDGYFNYVKSI